MKGRKYIKNRTYKEMLENSNSEEDDQYKITILRLPKLFYKNYISQVLEQLNVVTKKNYLKGCTNFYNNIIILSIYILIKS